MVSAQAGYSKQLWGKKAYTKDLPKIGPPRRGGRNWKFGYVRPVVNINTAGIMNQTGAELEFYPISLLGFAVGHSFHQRPDFSTQFDCKLVSCQGTLQRTSIRTQVGLGFDRWFSTLTFRREWIQSSVKGRLFTDEGAGVIGNSGGDQLNTYNFVFGRTLSREISVGYNLLHARFVQNRNHSVTQIFFVNKIFKDFGLVVGAGSFHSDHMPIGLTVVTMLQFNVFRPIGIF